MQETSKGRTRHTREGIEAKYMKGCEVRKMENKATMERTRQTRT